MLPNKSQVLPTLQALTLLAGCRPKGAVETGGQPGVSCRLLLTHDKRTVCVQTLTTQTKNTRDNDEVEPAHNDVTQTRNQRGQKANNTPTDTVDGLATQLVRTSLT